MNRTCLLGVFAHPDDETFRPGGALALLARKGVEVQVLTATRGQQGSCGQPPLCTRDELPDVRAGELECACAALGIQTPRLLDYEDGQLAQADHEVLLAQILAVIDEFQPQILLSFGPDGLSGHPDHIAIGESVAQAYHLSPDVSALYTMAIPHTLAEKLSMPQIRSVAEDKISLHVDVSSIWDAKQKAMACHATQLSSTPMLSASEEEQRLFFGHEHFSCPACRNPELDFMPEVLKAYCQ